MLLLILLTLLVVTLLIVGVTLSLIDVDRYNFALYLILLGIVSLCVIVALWLIRPSALMRWPRCCRRLCPGCFGPKKYRVPESKVILDPTNAETVMKSIRGIPYLMQAIQYSMETTYYSDMMAQMGSGPVQASVIHTAPGCRSLLDSDTESDCCCHCGGDDQQMPSVFVEQPPISPRTSLPDEQWEPTNSRWSNAQLRLDISRRQSYLPVFPLSEAAASAAMAPRLAHLQDGFTSQSLDRLYHDESAQCQSESCENQDAKFRRDDENKNLLKVGDFAVRKSSSATMLHQSRRQSTCSCRSNGRKISNPNTKEAPVPRGNVQIMRMGKNGVFLHRFLRVSEQNEM
uniref:Uncharacterized protein n=1 Tax=Plectus sambesii TaxID=2011161 RepID=A0A914V1M1_9BILA